MEKSVKKSYFLGQAEKEKSFSSNDETKSVGNKSKKRDKKEVNSWDCSTPSNNGKISKRKINDWESSSECQETMVEPFDSTELAKECDNWDSDSESERKKISVTGDKVAQHCTLTVADSLDLSIGNISNTDKSSSENLLETGRGKNHEEDRLFVEDFEEFLKDDNDRKSLKLEEITQSPGSSALGSGKEKVRSKQSEGTPEDTTIWMIPKTERTQSGESTSRLISSSDKVKIEKLSEVKKSFKKSKSLSDVEKKQSARSSRSERLGSQKNNYNNFLLCEGSHLQRKLELNNRKENISGCESFDRTRVFFTEYECRTVTMDKDNPEKLSPKIVTSASEFGGADEIMPEFAYGVSNENPPQSPLDPRNDNEIIEEALSEMVRPGPSGITSLDVISLPDMTGKNSIKERQKEKNWLNSDGERNEKKLHSEPIKRVPMGESWLLLDDTGHYRAITRNEVSILLNGRSAEAVLQGRKQHFISNISLKDTASLKNSLSCMLAKESFSFLREEDMGGEDDRKNVLDLERKMENTLFYIQPGMNLTASIRIIPLETEMINLWRRTKDGGSVLSSEVDLLNPSQDSVEMGNQRHPVEPRSSVIQLPRAGLNLNEHDENLPKPSTANGPLDAPFSQVHVNESAEYRKLLFETRNIVDSLTNNFQTLQSRLEGETNRSSALQVEVNKLRVLLKKQGWRYQDLNSRDSSIDPRASVPASLSILTLDSVDKSDIRSESAVEEVEDLDGSKPSVTFSVQDRKSALEQIRCLATQSNSNEVAEEENDIITVNIYTVESISPIPSMGGKPQEMYSLVHSNLKMIESKMKRLQQENDSMLKQNKELKRKLKEISQELERYMAGTSEQDACNEEGKGSETPRDQVCNLKLELENLKTLMREQRQQLAEENSLISEEFTKSMFALTEWCTMASNVFEKVRTAKGKLQEAGVTVDVNLEQDSSQDPKTFQNLLICYVEQTAQCLVTIKIENFLLGKSMKEDTQKQTKEVSGLDQVISGYSHLVEQCRKGRISGEAETKVMEDYFAVIMEKASLVEEVKILKTENEMLLESQLQHYEKLKQTMVTLKDRTSEISALEAAQKLSEEERSKMSEVLRVYVEEKSKMEKEIAEKTRTIESLMEEKRRKESEFNSCSERVKMAVCEIENFEKSVKIKDELISNLKMENKDLLAAEEIKSNQIQILKEEVKNLEMRGSQLEAELYSSKNFISESHKEMRDYITHLEALVNSSQESVDKMKQKLKDSNQIINRLKSENDVLDKQHQCDLKLFNNTKDELDSYKEKLSKTRSKLRESEEEREKLDKKCEVLTGSEKEKSEALDALSKEFKLILEENVDLKKKVEIFSKDKDESLKEQKDLINKYSMLSKEIQKLQEKYRSVKSECNQRTDLIGCLEMMLKENLAEYNSRIACLEGNISRIIEKIMACKNGMRETHFGVDSEVIELRHQLDVTYQERKELESVVSNYHSLMKRLECEIQQRESKMDELNVKLTLEQQKALEYENERKSSQVPEAPKFSELLKIQQLEQQIEARESELAECKKELQLCQTDYENEKKKMELTISDLKSEVRRYQLRVDVIMKNLSTNKSVSSFFSDKRNADDSEVQNLKKELQEKNKTIADLNETIINFKAEVKMKESNLESFSKKSLHHDEEMKLLQNQIAKIRESTSVLQQKEKDEMAEKLFQSMKLVVEERSSRQALETVAVEKEKHFRDEIEKIKNELLLKVRECQTVSEALEDKKKLVSKSQDELKKLKAEVVSLRKQVEIYKKRCHQGNGDDSRTDDDHSLNRSKAQKGTPERLESCLRELKEVRDLNLQLRKAEGQYQAKIVLLEEEIRSARLLIKELQGDIKTEKKSKKALKNMIVAAKMEIEKCLLAKQLMSVVADKISRHLDLSEIPSRELLSGFRDSSGSPTIRA